MPTLPLPLPSTPFPSTMLAAVMDYRKMASDYESTSDATIKASYKVILDKKIADLRQALAAYMATANAEIDALVVA